MRTRGRAGRTAQTRLLPHTRKLVHPTKTFTESKSIFDRTYGHADYLQQSLVPVDGKYLKVIGLKDAHGAPNEEYYKWQFIFGLIDSGLYIKDYIGTEVSFPKGNKNAAPLRVDACVFDSPEWLVRYNKWKADRNDKDSLEFLRHHCIFVVEFKRGKDKLEDVFSTQLRPAMKEPDANFVLGSIYDMGRLYLFQRKSDGSMVRYDETKNKGAGGVQNLSLELTDSYLFIPDFDELSMKVNKPASIDRSNRSIWDLDIVTSRSSVQVKDALNRILRALDEYNLVNQRGYEILIQTLALKIFDEKRNQRNKNVPLEFYVKDDEVEFRDLNEGVTEAFVDRMKSIYSDAEEHYQGILKNSAIDWNREPHVRVVQSIIQNFQDYSLVRSHQSDLYQLVFYNFAQPFQKGDKGQFLTPIPLIEFLVRMVNPRGNEKLCDPCVGIGDFLSSAYVMSSPKMDDENMWGVDSDDNMIALAQLNMLLNGDGNASLLKAKDKGSILYKVAKSGALVSLIPDLHRGGNWDNWKDETKLMKFDVVLTNPPFGKGRPYQIETPHDRKVIEMYETWGIYGGKSTNSSPQGIDQGVVFLENAYRILGDEGRFGIVVSNSIASTDEWRPIREWLAAKMRIVALIDLPPDVFAETGVNTTLIVAYKPKKSDMRAILESNYSIFTKEISKVGYEKRTYKRNVVFVPIYRIDPSTYEVVIDENGAPMLEEEFTQVNAEFRDWARRQEEALQRLFVL